MRYTDDLWQSIHPIYEAIITHPFNVELAEGTLPREKFLFYIQQDALYLLDFGRALAILAGRSETPQQILELAHCIEEAILSERGLHESYFKVFGVSEPTTELSPANFAYTNYLLSTATLRPYEEGLGALLPCFWIYREVGRHVLKQAAANNPYQQWIDLYASTEFSETVDRILELVEQYAQDCTPTQRQRMQKAFRISSQLEWWFWDSAYRLEWWEV